MEENILFRFRVFAKAGVEAIYGGGYDRDQMFYEINYIDFYDKEVSVWGCHHKDCGICDDTYKMEDVEIMMSTGLKDKSGVEIFEGDVISELSEQGEDWANHILAEVVWHKAGFYGKEKGHEPEYPITEFVKGEVIGNIYENPELLEEQ